jgi:hypothetical protein
MAIRERSSHGYMPRLRHVPAPHGEMTMCSAEIRSDLPMSKPASVPDGWCLHEVGAAAGLPQPSWSSRSGRTATSTPWCQGRERPPLRPEDRVRPRRGPNQASHEDGEPRGGGPTWRSQRCGVVGGGMGHGSHASSTGAISRVRRSSASPIAVRGGAQIAAMHPTHPPMPQASADASGTPEVSG